MGLIPVQFSILFKSIRLSSTICTSEFYARYSLYFRSTSIFVLSNRPDKYDSFEFVQNIALVEKNWQLILETDIM